MPKILIVAATPAEVEPALKTFNINAEGSRGFFMQSDGGQNVMAALTGVGMVNTAFELGKLIGSHFDLVINAGLAGSFTHFKTGDVVSVPQDCFSELGAEDGDNFISFDQLGFGEQCISIHNPFENDCLKNIPRTNGITVNTVHGREKSIRFVTEKYQPHVETMEGAAFIHAANAFSWRAVQLRAISNLVERRNRDAWDIPLALDNLNKTIVDIVRAVNH